VIRECWLVRRRGAKSNRHVGRGKHRDDDGFVFKVSVEGEGAVEGHPIFVTHVFTAPCSDGTSFLAHVKEHYGRFRKVGTKFAQQRGGQTPETVQRRRREEMESL